MLLDDNINILRQTFKKQINYLANSWKKTIFARR